MITNAIADRRIWVSFSVSPDVFSSGLGYDGPWRRGFGDDGPVDDYELIDAGGGARLERFGEHVTDRPHGGAYGQRRDPERWERCGPALRPRGWLVGAGCRGGA